jgi:hypothetical protein
MVPGFGVDRPVGVFSFDTGGQSRVALASPWDNPPPGGPGGTVCGQLYSNTKCVDPVLLCQNCRMCRSNEQGLHEVCGFWYPCGVCVGTQGW